MSITTIGYLIFFTLGLILYYTLFKNAQWVLLLTMSFIFVFSHNVFGIAVIILISYTAFNIGKNLGGIVDFKKKRQILCIGIIFILLSLVFLKYVMSFSAFSEISLFGEDTISNFVKRYVYPIGLSYFTLQLVSYVLDVYWERIDPEVEFKKVLLYTCYFPQLVQGPISKYQETVPQLFANHKFEWKNLKYGIQLMIWGFFKKMVVADVIGQYVGDIFFAKETPYGFTIIIGLLFYGIQLYGDFSGGIDIIRGVSECFDVNLKENFRQPYFSMSLAEFWRRWHMSLGEWMKDYLFYPLAISKKMNNLKKLLKHRYSRKTSNKICISISNIIVFLIVGLWHGTGTNFCAWGLYNGVILAISELLDNKYNEWKNKLKIRVSSVGWKTFCIVRTILIVSVGRVFDCTSSASDAVKMFVNIFRINQTNMGMLASLANNKLTILTLIVGILIVLIVDIAHEKQVIIRDYLATKPFLVQLIVWTFMIQFIACFGRIVSAGGFMYANF